ncbi:MAG TPA: GNAT family N-acetyltransferase [Armatimonadota bacterium]|jgi:ribosomal protein S18 acetylase RimI-like enzyme
MTSVLNKGIGETMVVHHGLTYALRTARPSDASSVLAVQYAAYALREEADPPYQALIEGADDVRAQIEGGGGTVAVAGHRIVGCIRFREEGPGVLLGMRLAVHPEFQRRGIGSRLIRSLDAYARHRHCHTLHLHVRRSADHLIAMYRRCGFEIVEHPTDPDYNHPVFLVMSKSVDGTRGI